MTRRKMKYFNVIAALTVSIFFMCVFNIGHVQATNGNDDLVYTYGSPKKSPLIDSPSQDVSKIVLVTIHGCDPDQIQKSRKENPGVNFVTADNIAPTIEKLNRFNEPLVVQFMSVRVDFEAIQAIQKVKKIQGLLFDKCRFDNDDWSELNMVPWKTSDELSSLVFSRCEPFDAVSKIVSSTPKLEHLELWGIDLSQENAQTFLNDFGSLTSLTLIGCKLSDNFVQELSRKKIRHLTLNRISLSEKDAEILSRFSLELESLQLIHCECPKSLNALEWNPSLKILKIDE